MLKTKDRRKVQRKHMNRKYGQAKLKPAKKGVASCFIAGGILLLCLVLITLATVNKGTAGAFVGGFGIIAVIFAVIGILAAFRGFKERDKNYLSSKIGLGINGFLLISLLLIFVRGFL